MQVTVSSTILTRALHALACAAVLIAGPAQAAPALDAECVLAPSRTVDVASSVPGRLERVLVERSQPVNAGDVIAELESSVERAELAVAQARAELSAEASLAKARLDYDKRNARRLASLHAVSAATEFERDRASRDAQVSSWRVERAAEVQNLQRLELARTRMQLENRTVRSPIDGFVLRRHRSAGEFVEDQPIATIVSLDPLHVEAVVGLELLGRIYKGMRALVSLEAGSGEPREAEVSVVDRVVDAASATFGVRLSLPNPTLDIPAGLKCRVRFLAQREASADHELDATIEQAEATDDIEPVDEAHASTLRVRQAQPPQSQVVKAAPCTRIGPIDDPNLAMRAKRRLSPLTGIPHLQQDQASAWWLELPVPADAVAVRAALGDGLAELVTQCRSATPDAVTADAGAPR